MGLSAVARRHGLNANLLFTWRREMGTCISALAEDPMAFVPAVIGAAPVQASAPPSPGAGGRGPGARWRSCSPAESE
ncbi:MAG: hypothetical protein B7Y08_07770 [Rhodospirillales bacterium 24-66-33]|nr:MAG: hypothetical protein B7Y57_07475 [Rhodospirillales bacterium 35-66-84]OYZ95222.1 MAG: hypothetical protein B7Y08_07770 [Rhodospirillales bacterium 24-66-33]OZB20829.1 MAG: hypothetical protein B7X63_29735 [Rhodospirillales bacterium 39-66-50]